MRLALAVLFGLAAPVLAQPFVAPTEAKTPAEEQKTFKLPAGFEVQLVAAEPDIGKPIQMAFDAKGRLWVTTSRHYPFAAEGKASDKLFVLSDFGQDGKAKTVTTFADDLNIPIGILPLPDCKSCLVSTVGTILKLTDTNGDGKADRRDPLLTGFGTRDTHGMMNSFMLLPDGWVYACHGYLNDSTVKGTDGSTIRMQSGHTFRFRPDGTKLEHWTFGQVNPFGMTIDPYFNLYTADCHSKPITQLIRGAYYDSFGKPHDGLGYAPHVTGHDHASTALCGLTWYDADHFPKDWNGVMFLGNVTGNRVNADKIEWQGSTPVGKELPDFLVSSDPWFRPTDVRLGPDGALYVADFYNKIIGHYEVPLTHPGRDKDRGRVWRIVWTGENARPPEMPKDWLAATTTEVLQGIIHSNSTARLHAANEYVRRLTADPKLDTAAERGDILANLLSDAHKLSSFVGVLMMAEMAAKRPHEGKDFLRLVMDSDTIIQSNKTTLTGMLIRAMATRPEWGAEEREVAIKCVTAYKDATWLCRAAVDGMTAHPHADFVGPLSSLIRDCPTGDIHLKHAARGALRNALRDAEGGWAAAETEDTAVIGDVAAGVHTREAAGYVLKQVQSGKAEPRYCEHVGRYGDDVQAATVVAALKAKPAPVFAVQSLVRGLQARGGKTPEGTVAIAEAACIRAMTKPNVYTLAATTDLAAGLKLTTLFDPLAKFAANAKHPEGQRATALTSLMSIDPARAIPALGRTLTDPAAPAVLRERVGGALAGASAPAANEALLAALSAAPAHLAVAIATGLAGSPHGSATLLDAVRQGKASPRLLQEKGVAVRIALHDGGKFKPQVDELTKGLPSADAKIAAMIRSRSVGFQKTPADAVAGKAVFVKHCATCHQIGGEGAKVGPNLDGIGVRGAERLLEDILDPNRNIDVAFRATQLDLLDGRTLTGQLLREEGQVLVLADANGKEMRIGAKEIDKKQTSALSIMPANLDPAIPEADLYHLLAYLLTQTAKK